MAKKISDKEENSNLDNTQDKTVDNKEEQAQTPPQKETAIEKDIPAFIDGILQSLTGYEKVYIDSHGSAYTPTTAKQIRGNAILYKNPYYKSK